MLHPYAQQADDPDWLVRVGQFHGHLGPWVVIGAVAGRDAIERLHTRGYWDINVVCFMPPDRQRQPWSCILDGLQVSTGATLGKQNIRFAHDPQVLQDGRPAILVVNRTPASSAPAAMLYHVSRELGASLASLDSERLEALSREIAARPVDWLFEVRTLNLSELNGQFGGFLDGPHRP